MELFLLLKTQWHYLKEDQYKFIVFAFLVFFGSFFSLVYEYLFGLAVDNLVAGSFYMFSLYLFFHALYSIIDLGLFHFYKELLYTRIEINFFERITKDLFQKGLDLPVRAFDKMRVGELVNKIYTDPQQITNILPKIIRSVSRIIIVIFIIGLAATFSWILTVQFILLIIIKTIISLKYYPQIKSTSKKIKAEKDSFLSLANQIFFGVRDVKALGLKKNMQKLVDKNVKDLFFQSFRVRYFNLSYYTLLGLLGTFMELVIFLTLGYLYFLGDITLALFIAFQWYIWRLFDFSRQIAQLGADYQQVIVSLKRINTILDNELYDDEKFGNRKINKIKGEITFQDVNFAYDDQKVLDNFNLTIKPKQKIAIVGRSGVGKTTIFNLLLRFYDPDAGQILIDGMPITEFSQASLRKHIAIIRQEPYIFNKTIKENFKMIKPNITLREIRELCKKVYIDKYIMSLEDKYDTLIGEGGINLSGGQKQRLSIARSLAKKSKIILFDESTSSLDNESQNYIKNTINDLTKDHTVLIVAHRLSTIIDADLIILIDNGEVKAMGKHSDLLMESDLYNKLYQPEALELNV